jgi:hypothetical protein
VFYMTARVFADISGGSTEAVDTLWQNITAMLDSGIPDRVDLGMSQIYKQPIAYLTAVFGMEMLSVEVSVDLDRFDDELYRRFVVLDVTTTAEDWFRAQED